MESTSLPRIGVFFLGRIEMGLSGSNLRPAVERKKSFVFVVVVMVVVVEEVR